MNRSVLLLLLLAAFPPSLAQAQSDPSQSFPSSTGFVVLTEDNTSTTLMLANFPTNDYRVHFAAWVTPTSTTSVHLHLQQEEASWFYILTPSEAVENVLTLDCCAGSSHPVYITVYAQDWGEGPSVVKLFYSISPHDLPGIGTDNLGIKQPLPEVEWVVSLSLLMGGAVPVGLAIVVLAVAKRHGWK